MAGARRAPSKRSSSKKSARSTRSSPKSKLPSLPKIGNPLTTLVNLNVLGNAKATATMLTSVSGLKTFLERLGAYGAATSIAYAGVPELGGRGTAAMFKSLGLKGASGPLAPAGAAWFGAHWSFVQFLIGFGAILGIGSNSDIPALFTAMSLFLCGNTMIAGSSHGVRDVFIRNAMAFKYSNAILLLLTTRKARGYFSSKQAAALRKLAIAVPGLMMSFLMMQGSSMAKFTAAGMTGPGVLGPVAGLIFHPLHHVVSTCVALGYISGYSTRRAALFLCLELLIVATSLAPQMVQPWGRALSAMHLGAAMVFMRECTPTNSFIPKL